MNIKIGTNSLVLTITRGFSIVVMIIYFMILSRFLSLQEYGTFSQILLVSQFALIIFDMGLSSSINYFLSKEETDEGKKNFLSSFFTLIFLITLISGFLLFFFDSYISKFFNNPAISVYSFAFLIIPFSIVSKTSFDNILIVSNKVNNLLFFKVFHSVLLLISVSLSFYFKIQFKEFLILYILIEFFSSLIFLGYVNFKLNTLRFKIDIKLTKTILKFSIPLGLASSLSTINIQLDKFVIGRFFDTEKLAIYTNASKEIPVTIFSMSIIAVLMPIIVRELKRKNYSKSLELWNKSNELSLILISYFISIFLVFAPEVITVLYSKKYLDGVSIFRVYSIVLFLRFTYWGMFLNAMGKTKFIFYSSLISLVLNLFLNILFLKIFGIVGPAWATFFSFFIVALFQLFITSKEISISFLKIFDFLKLFKVSFYTSLLILFLWTIKKILIKINFYNLYMFFLTCGLYFVLYFLVIYRKKILSLWKELNLYKEEVK